MASLLPAWAVHSQSAVLVSSPVVFRSLQGSSSLLAIAAVKCKPRCTRSDAEELSREIGLWSIIIPTYNRLPILTKCLTALEDQVDYQEWISRGYEVIVVDDGSTDGTLEFLLDVEREEASRCDRIENLPLQSRRFPHAKVLKHEHSGATKARNLGFRNARGEIVVFIDSDLVVTRHFLKEHGKALQQAYAEDGDDRAFTYGRVINTNNFDNPQSEKFKITDSSRAFFATGNVAISRTRLLAAAKVLGENADGPFDADFSEYGWEDLELGVRLRQGGARIKHAPEAVGYHWHPAFTCEQIPRLIEQEKQRGRNGVRFYRKHPTFRVRLMIQMTLFHEALWFLLTLGGLLNERTLAPLLGMLVNLGHARTAAALMSPVLNWHNVQAVKEESKRSYDHFEENATTLGIQEDII